MLRTLLLATSTLALTACSGESAPEPDMQETAEAALYSVTITVKVPAESGAVYLASNLPDYGPWRADGLPMEGDGTTRHVTLPVPAGHLLQYKVTRGNWQEEGLADPAGVPRNFQLLVDGPQAVSHVIDHWKRPTIDYINDWQGSGVLGTLVYWLDVPSEFLGPTRHVEIWLPPGYEESAQRYPVIYMHDGQNLFDPRIANTGTDWGVDEAIMRGVEAGTSEPAIVVGIWSGELRGRELSPWDLGDDYARFITEEIMPRINAEFRTLTGPENTMTMGSSMGGLISFHLIREYPDVFGACGCVSTHFPFNAANHEYMSGVPVPDGVDPERPFILDDVAAGETVPESVRMWFDYGTETLDASYEPTHLAVRDWLLAQGFEEGRDFVVRRYDGAAHNEASWRARLDDPVRFLLGVEE